jgi:outer membrane protein assembly factor BamB
MQIKHSIHVVCTAGIILLLMLGFIIPETRASAHIYPDDGIWEDTFSDSSSVDLSNCIVKDDQIVLKQEPSKLNYNFSQRPQMNHKAYAYRKFFFFPFGSFLTQKTPDPRSEFEDNYYDYIRKVNHLYAYSSAFSPIKSVVHHFRFHVDIDTETVGNISFSWYGKANVNAKLKFYFWNSDAYPNGKWQPLGDTLGYRSTGKDTIYEFTIEEGEAKSALDWENYVDICVVSHLFSFRNTLYTNFVNILTHAQGYTLKNATVKTKNAIDPKNISLHPSFSWDFLCWDDSQPTGTEIRYHILYQNGSRFDFVEDAVLPDNHKGFNVSPVYLNTLSNHEYGTKYGKLKIQANLSTNSPAVSPRIFSWAITWQNRTSWQDLFYTYYRIDERTRITKENETIMISLIQDEWPLFGFNSGNTRASDSIGAKTADLYWYSEASVPVGGGFRNPVIGDGMVYILSSNRSLHQYNVKFSSTSGIKYQANTASVPINYNVVNSPAVTDELVIVATGQQANGGTENHIYAYQTNNLTLRWQDSYDQNICYDASPVVFGDTIFISTWGGDNGKYLNENNRYTNNKLLALDLNTGQKRWEYPLPAPSYSTPAVTSDMIIVACRSTSNHSVIALSLTGEKIWSKAVGAVGRASPVVHGDMVFVTCLQPIGSFKTATKIVAMSRNDGTIKWNTTVSEIANCIDNLADSTPALYDGVLYIASPDGEVHALNIDNGTAKWSPKKIYSRFPICTVLTSSPAYADNHVYVGTPKGEMYAINAATGDIKWKRETFKYQSTVLGEPSPSPVFGSPVVSNGLVFFADEHGYLYSIGKFTTSTKEVTGRIISSPIRLPESLWWNTFYAHVSYNSSISSIKFKLLDENKNVLKENLTNGSALTLGNRTLGRTIRLQADFSAKNLTLDNPKLLRWYITLKTDTQKPFLDMSSFTPDPKGWLQEIVPVFTIKVKDNITGLQVTSARYTLEYTANNVTQKTTAVASCTGVNGTTEWQLMTMNISTLPIFENITSLHSLEFKIADLAGNTAEQKVLFKQDVKKPTSKIITDGMKNKYNSTYVLINAKANDTGTLNVDASGIKRVELYYRYSQNNTFSGNWIFFADSSTSLPSWRFNFTSRPEQNGGYFELCTVAIDNASNVEDFPAKGDVSFMYDWKAPQLPSVSGDTLWFNERPQFSVVFKDDFRLDTIQYRPNFEQSWTTIASSVNASVYNTDAIGRSWILKQEYWDFMIEDEVYYIYLKINDTLGNTLLVTSDSEALSIRKDMFPPIVSIDVPDVTTEWTWVDNFTVSGIATDRNGSGVKEAVLYYRYSEDKRNWSSWTLFGDSYDSSAFEWNFKTIEGDGHYEVKINVIDYAGNAKESETISISVASFPTTLAYVMVGLVVILLIISLIVVFIWRKRK